MKKIFGIITLIAIAVLLGICGILGMSLMIAFSAIGFYIHFGCGIIMTFVNMLIIVAAWTYLVNAEKKNK